LREPFVKERFSACLSAFRFQSSAVHAARRGERVNNQEVATTLPVDKDPRDC